MCDLGLRIEGTALEARIAQLYEELDARGVPFHPHCWLSDEWFSPDGVPGIAIPFYLAHPRLARLERKELLEVEGGTKDWCLKILRHETGHALDTAFRLHRRKGYRALFGRYTKPYPDHYRPRPYSKYYVRHLEPSYAQAHPAEDFAETFAVWVKPRSSWRSTYVGWPALRKLEYLDELMSEIRDGRPLVSSRKHFAPLSKLKMTLGEHYAHKRQHYGVGNPNGYDRRLKRLFSTAPRRAGRPTAATFLREFGPELRRAFARQTGEYPQGMEHVLREMIRRCRELRLNVDRPLPQTKREVVAAVTAETLQFLSGACHRVAL